MENNRPKKSRFLKFLWILFSFFVLILITFGIILYFSPYWGTSLFLNLYSQRLATVLTSPDFYEFNLDKEYNKKLDNYQELLEKRKEEAKKIFKKFIILYAANPQENWVPYFKKIDSKIQEIFMDKKVSPQEFSSFLNLIENIIENIQEKILKNKPNNNKPEKKDNHK